MKTKCLIVDDEPLARELIRGHIGKLENFEIVAECDNAMKAMNALRNSHVDLMFLDIKMPQMTGIDFLKTLKRPPKVIITTAYSQYALDGFELDVVDYLMKPVTFERFFKAVNKYFQSGNHETVELENGKHHPEAAFIYVKKNKKVNRRLVVKSSLQSIENKLPSDQFIRIHKSYIVSIPRIRAFNATTIELENAKLRIGRNYKNQVFSALHYKQEI